VNPARTAVVDGVLRPAVVVVENESSGVPALDGTFRLTWGSCANVGGGSKLMKMSCTIEYMTPGCDGTGGDRGRVLGAMDGELMAISRPLRAVKVDYAKVPPVSMGTQMFWTDLDFAEPKDEAGRINRTASTTVYFVNEVKE
jgi:hypothetical protein